MWFLFPPVPSTGRAQTSEVLNPEEGFGETISPEGYNEMTFRNLTLNRCSCQIIEFIIENIHWKLKLANSNVRFPSESMIKG